MVKSKQISFQKLFSMDNLNRVVFLQFGGVIKYQRGMDLIKIFVAVMVDAKQIKIFIKKILK